MRSAEKCPRANAAEFANTVDVFLEACQDSMSHTGDRNATEYARRRIAGTIDAIAWLVVDDWDNPYRDDLIENSLSYIEKAIKRVNERRAKTDDLANAARKNRRRYYAFSQWARYGNPMD